MTSVPNKNKIVSGKQAQEALLKGVNLLADTVGSSLGPKGQNTGIARATPAGEVYNRIILHDGVSIARAVDIEDETVNFGAQILKEAAQKQVDACGDGTTVVTILAQAILNEAMKLVFAGQNPMPLRKGLEEGRDKIIEVLQESAIPLTTDKQILQIATISAGDTELGHLVAEVYTKLGKEAVITVEESKSPVTSIDYQTGMQLDKGYVSPYFISNPDLMESVQENACVLVTDKPITDLSEFTEGFFKDLLDISKQLFIISPEISGIGLALLIQHRMTGKLFPLCVQAPSFGDDQKNILQDIAILTGAKFISQDAGFKFRDLKVEDLGFAEYISATKDEAIITGGRGRQEAIDERVASIKKQIKESDSDFDKERLRFRLGKLTNGVSVIHCGGKTEIEMKERRERLIDAIAATRAALNKGITAGGEVAYLMARKALTNSVTDRILYTALYEPFLRLITNANLDETAAALALQGKSSNMGIDVRDGKVKNMIKSGIVDPVSVPIEAIKNSVSVSIQIMTTVNLIIPITVQEKKF